MIIDKTELHNGIWYEDEEGNYISFNDAVWPPPENAVTRHVCFPLEIREEIYNLRNCDGRLKKRKTVTNL